MQNWPEIPVVATLQAILEEKEKRTEVDAKSLKGTLGEHLKEAILDTLKSMPQQDSPCTCEATVICSNATENSVPVHIIVNDETVHLSGLQLINQTDIQLGSNFTGCKKAEDGLCKITENYLEWIWGQKWQDADKSSGQGEGKESLSLENSFMVCTEYGGMIYFHDNGQGVRSFIEGTQICYLSDEYLEWLKQAEGCMLLSEMQDIAEKNVGLDKEKIAEKVRRHVPYVDMADKTDARAAKTVTMAYGFTFNQNGGEHWEMIKEVTGWEDDDLKKIIDILYNTPGAELGKYTLDQVEKLEEYTLTEEQAEELLMVAIPEYMNKISQAVDIFNEQNGYVTQYTQNEWEAMFDAVYNGGTGTDEKDGEDNVTDPFGQINDDDYILYYYLRKDREGAIIAIEEEGKGGNRRRLNQIEIFFENNYIFTDNLNEIRVKYGIRER